MRDNKIDIMAIGRDCDGFVLGGCLRFKNDIACMDWVELDAIWDGLVWAINKNITHISLEFDCASMVNRINHQREDITFLGHYIEGIRSLHRNFFEVEIWWFHRDCNKIADKLSLLATDSCYNSDFNMDYPRDIHYLIISDLV